MQTIFGKQTPEFGKRVGGTTMATRPSTYRPLPLNNVPASARIPRATPKASQSALPTGKSKPNSDMGNRGVVEALTHSKVYQEYEKAFTEATGLPVALRPAETWQLPLHGKRCESPYCALISEKSRACASCLQTQEKLAQAAANEAHTLVCPAGLSETAVPVRVGGRLIGYLLTGQVFARTPTEAQYERMVAMVKEWGVEVDEKHMKEAYFATRVLPRKGQDSATVLLTIFAQHLAMLSNQVLVRQENAEPPVITKAKAYITEHQAEDLRLGQVARAVGTSTFYFCKIFKRATGINFTDYLARVRIESAKNLLLNPNLRISEIAYEVGFQSLTHFNRVFKKVLGEAPTEYRTHLMGARHE
jgi:AraC-like DNA-binding protein/ligand-binding sensor protein